MDAVADTGVEIANDAAAPNAADGGEGDDAGSLRTPATRIDVLMRWTLIAITASLACVVGRVVQLQTRPGERLAGFMDDCAERQVEKAVHGDIRDRRDRVITATRFGDRVVVDPLVFPNPPGEALSKLSNALGQKVETLAAKIVPKMSANLERAARLKDNDPSNDPKHGAIRFVPITGVLEDWQASAVKSAKIPGVFLEQRSVREVADSSYAEQLVGKMNSEGEGNLGVEKMVRETVRPVDGVTRCITDAWRRPLWVEEGGYIAPQRGENVNLSIDLEVQRIATEELERGLKEADAAGGRVVAMDPHTGEILAMVDVVRDLKDVVDYKWDHVIGQETGGRPRYRTVKQDPARFKEPALARNRCVEDMYEPGSTFKPFMWSATTALGLAKPNEIFDTEDGFWKTPYGRPLKDVTVRGKQSWTDVLVNSSNIGMTKGTSRMSAEQMHAAVRGFGFGQPVKLGLPGESPGRVTSLKNWSKYTHTSVAMGYEVAVTPVQMVRAFSAFARTGEQAGTIPDVSLIAVSSDSAASRGTRVLPPEIAELTRKTMRGVAENLERKVLKNESQGYRYDAFGKSGTAQIPLPPRPKDRKLPKGVPGTGYFVGQYNVSFICGAPAESPRMVVLVVVDDPGPRLVRENRYYGAMVAGPVARRVVERSLAYMGVPPVTAETHTPVLAAAE